MNSSLFFTIINERGGKEDGVGVGVEREVYSLFWKQFTNSMTIGERKRVPFIRHDHFIKEWKQLAEYLSKDTNQSRISLCSYLKHSSATAY